MMKLLQSQQKNSKGFPNFSNYNPIPRENLSKNSRNNNPDISNLSSPSIDLDQIIETIISDEKLFQYVMKLVKNRITPRDMHDPIFLRHIIDAAIETAIEQIQVVDIVKNLLQEQQAQNDQQQLQYSTNQSQNYYNGTTKSYANGQYSHQLALDIGDQDESVERLRGESNFSENDLFVKPNYSEKEPEPINTQTVKRTLHQLNKNKPPLATKKDISQNIPAQPLSIATEFRGDFSVGDSDRNSFLSVDTARESNASTVQITLPLDKSVTAENPFPKIPERIFNDSEEEEENYERSPGIAADDQDEQVIDPRKNDDRYQNKNTDDGMNANKLNSFVNQSFQVTSEYNSVQNSLDLASLQRKSSRDEENAKGPASNGHRQNEEDDALRYDENETVKDWERKILQELKQQQKDDDDDDANHHNNPNNQSNDFSILSEPIHEDEEYRPVVTKKSTHQSQEEDQENNNPEESDGKKRDSNQSYESNRYEDEDFEEDHSHHSHDSNDLLHSKYSSAHYPKHHPIPATSPSSNHQADDNNKDVEDDHDYLSADYNPLAKSKTTFVFDPDQFNRDVDAATKTTEGGKERKSNRVHFIDGVVADVIYYERPAANEARDMFYSHEELDRFDEHYRKEDRIAERMGLSWMEWKNQQPDDQEISFSDDDRDNDDDYGYDYDHHQPSNTAANNDRNQDDNNHKHSNGNRRYDDEDDEEDDDYRGSQNPPRHPRQYDYEDDEGSPQKRYDDEDDYYDDYSNDDEQHFG